LRIAQGSHYVPAYDVWYDEEYARRWGDEHDVDVVVDHYPLSDMYGRAQSEVAARRGHDIVGLIGAPAAVFEDEVIDLGEVVAEVEATLGKVTPAIGREIYSRRSDKYFAFPDFWIASLALYRTDLWAAVEPGGAPDTWDDLVRVGARLKAVGAPVGIGFGSGLDVGHNPFGLLFTHGAHLQDEAGNLALDRPATIEAVQTMAALFRTAMPEDVLAWDDAADNRFLSSGRGGLTLDPVSAIRAIEEQDAVLAEKIGLLPPPAGPAARLYPQVLQNDVVWKFSDNQDLAKRFLVDLAIGYREHFARSRFYNLPGFAGAVPDLREMVNEEQAGKYGLLADAPTWSTNLGHPGDTNAAVAEVFHQGILVRMMAAAARGELSAAEAVKRAAAEAAPIFDKWRKLGKI
jgi:multiple sugar transport system substrate-binding protein